MKYLNAENLKSFEPAAFRNQLPFPWANPSGLVSRDGMRELRDNLPDLSLFKKSFDKPRKFGQKSHDRYSLKYHDGLQVPEPWQAFIEELRGDEYARFLRATLGARNFNLSFFWFFTPSGCSVSPHCDHANKIGAHLFYLNSETDWEPGWGGETLILEPEKKLKRASAPEFKDFSTITAGATSGTHSLLFKRTRNSWHGVREIDCPEGYMRKVFMVSIQHTNVLSRLYHLMAA